VELTLRLGLTAHRFLRGHRIRVHVTSSFFPHLDRNPNTGRSSAVEARLVPARQTVFHDEGRPSRVVLPVSTG
jgi:predicted acyl esterase